MTVVHYPFKDGLPAICRIAEEAGALIMGYYGRETPVQTKANNSPLTLADSAAHDFIGAALRRYAPPIPMVSEEDELVPGAEFERYERYWLVDPLDGTKEFINQTGLFTVNIALIEGDYPVFGIIHAPVSGVTYYAYSGEGAYRQSRTEEATLIHTRPLNATHPKMVASRDHAGDSVQRLLLRHPGAELLSIGSSLKFCLVAEGQADVYLRDIPTCEWDTGAAQCIVEEAGGQVCTLDGERLAYNKLKRLNPSLLTCGENPRYWLEQLGSGDT